MTDDSQQPDQDTTRTTVELPRVVLGSDDEAKAPQKRVLQGLVDRRWLSYPAYGLCFAGGAASVHFALDTVEWSAAPVAIAWLMLFFWEWIYGVAYGYRRTILKYFSFLMVLGLTAGLALLCFERGGAQLVATAAGQLTERGAVSGLSWAATAAIASGVLITAHVVILGRGYREKKRRGTVAGSQ